MAQDSAIRFGRCTKSACNLVYFDCALLCQKRCLNRDKGNYLTSSYHVLGAEIASAALLHLLAASITRSAAPTT